MKRYAFYMLIMAVAAVAACQKSPVIEENAIEEQTPTGTYIYTVNASIPETKSDYDGSGNFSWSAGDAISVLFHKDDDNKFFTLTRVSGTGNTATFRGNIDEDYVIGASDGTGSDKKIFAFYPASTSHSYTEGNYPSFYTPAVNDLSGENYSANIPMYDKLTEEGSFSFKLMTCAYKFTISDLDVSKIRVDVHNEDSYYLSGLTSMSSSGYLRYDGASKDISYILDVASKTAVVYVSCRYGGDKHFRPTITIKDYTNGYTIKQVTATNAVNIPDKKVKRLTISAPGTGTPLSSTLGIDWYGGTNPSIVSANGSADGVKVIKATADDDYLYILFGVKKSLLLYREASYPRSNNIQIYFNSASPGHLCYLYRNGVAQINDANASLSGSQIIELDEDDSVFCEYKIARTYAAAITSAGTVGVKVCVFYDFWIDNDWNEHTDWSKYVYSPEVTVTLP